MIIAVDGSAASGKGTLAKRLARHFDLAHLDTGGLYRALALHLMRSGITAETAEEHSAAAQIAALDLELINSPAIRDDSVAGMASVIAAMPAVRAGFLVLQRDFASHPPTGRGAVLDGRDIGSVVLPDAPVKFFVDADIEIRAERRTNVPLPLAADPSTAMIMVDPRRWQSARHIHSSARRNSESLY